MQSLLNGLVNPDAETIADEDQHVIESEASDCQERRKKEQEEQRAEATVRKGLGHWLCKDSSRRFSVGSTFGHTAALMNERFKRQEQASQKLKVRLCALRMQETLVMPLER